MGACETGRSVGANPLAAHGLRAESHARCATKVASALAVSLPFAPSACTDAAGRPGTPSKPASELQQPVVQVSPAARATIDALVQALTPLRADLTSDILDRHYVEQRELLEKLRSSKDREIGIAALQAYVAYKGDQTLVRRGLLDVAAHAAPEESRELLKTLTLEYGFPIDDRTYACEFLAKTSPETYLEIAAPYVKRRGRPVKTMPNDEFFVRGWIVACASTGRSSVPELADVATNLQMEDAARRRRQARPSSDPARTGSRDLARGIDGNGYIRRWSGAIAGHAPAERRARSSPTFCRTRRTSISRRSCKT